MEYTLGIVLATLAKEGLVSAFMIALFPLAVLSGSMFSRWHIVRVRA